MPLGEVGCPRWGCVGAALGGSAQGLFLGVCLRFRRGPYLGAVCQLWVGGLLWAGALAPFRALSQPGGRFVFWAPLGSIFAPRSGCSPRALYRPWLWGALS